MAKYADATLPLPLAPPPPPPPPLSPLSSLKSREDDALVVGRMLMPTTPMGGGSVVRPSPPDEPGAEYEFWREGVPLPDEELLPWPLLLLLLLERNAGAGELELSA